MRSLIPLAAACLLASPAVAHAQDGPCITADEFSSLAGYALPNVITAAQKRCAATLAPQAFLNTGGPALATRYAARKPATWAVARAAFLKLSASGNKSASFLKDIPDESLQEVLDVFIEGMVSQEIPLEECGTIDEFVRLLAPLPPENMAELVGKVVELSTKSKPAKPGKLNICRS